MSELKPCPFCGGDYVQFIEYKAGYGTVGCGDCCFEYPDSQVTTYPKAEAIEAWNTRHELTCKFMPYSEKSDDGICSKCGAYMYEQDNYCPSCGAKVVGE